jgi:tetratricopeptide (TPR) repeat protein
MAWFLALRRVSACLLLLTFGVSWAQPAPPPGAAQDQLQQQQLAQGIQLLRSGRTQEAISQKFDPVIAYYEEIHRKASVRAYSSRSQTESLFYLLEAATSKQEPRSDAAVYSANWGDAYYVKAYALIELKRLSEAKAALLAAVALAPRNAQYLGELGNLHLMERDWNAAKPVFDAAETAAREFSSKDVQTAELTRALRGQGFVLIETNQLDEAAKRYRTSLEIDANDTRAKNQLAYIEQRRAAAARGTVGAPTSASNGSVATIDQAWQAAEQQNAESAAQGYSRQWAAGGAVWNDNGVQKRAVMPHEKAIAECVTAIFPQPKSARMVFTVNEAGVVVEALSDQTGLVAECIEGKLPGHRVPVPPKAPFYLCTSYQVQGEAGSVTAGCGPRHLASVCERKGTSTTCSLYQR